MRSRAIGCRTRCDFIKPSAPLRAANSRLSTLLISALRRVLGEATFIQVVRDERPELTSRMRQQLDREAAAFGINVIDVRIRRADLPEQNSQAVYQRMQTERQREAAEFRAQGSQRSQEIRSRADRDVTVLIAEATSKAEQIRGEGDAQRNRIFADAYGRTSISSAFTDRCRPTKPACATTTPGCCSNLTPNFSVTLSTDRASPLRTPRSSRKVRCCGAMSDFLVALGLLFAIEGMVFAAFRTCQAGNDACSQNPGQHALQRSASSARCSASC